MKPFDLKKALAGHPLVTRDGEIASHFQKPSESIKGFPYSAKIAGLERYFAASGKWCFEDSSFDLFLAGDSAPSKPRTKSETRKNVERVKKIMGRSWMTLEEIETELHRHYGVFLPEQSVSARVRDLRKDEFGGYDIRKKQVGKGLFAYKNFGKKGAVK